MLGKLRNMTSIYLFRGQEVLLLFRQGSRVVNDVWLGTAGGHFEWNKKMVNMKYNDMRL